MTIKQKQKSREKETNELRILCYCLAISQGDFSKMSVKWEATLTSLVNYKFMCAKVLRAVYLKTRLLC